jgi:hypothetical protein
MREAKGIISIKVADDDPRSDKQILEHALAGYGRAEIVLSDGTTRHVRPVPPAAMTPSEEFGESEQARHRPRISEIADEATDTCPGCRAPWAEHPRPGFCPWPRPVDGPRGNNVRVLAKRLADAEQQLHELKQDAGTITGEDGIQVPEYGVAG